MNGRSHPTSANRPRGAKRRRAGELKTKRVRGAAEPSEGQRILITRLWPRGMTKADVDADWERSLAPSRELVLAYKRGKLTWTELARRFAAEMEAPESRAVMERVGDLVAGGATVTLLCECKAGPEGERGVKCHRRLVREWIDALARC